MTLLKIELVLSKEENYPFKMKSGKLISVSTTKYIDAVHDSILSGHQIGIKRIIRRRSSQEKKILRIKSRQRNSAFIIYRIWNQFEIYDRSCHYGWNLWFIDKTAINWMEAFCVTKAKDISLKNLLEKFLLPCFRIAMVSLP